MVGGDGETMPDELDALSGFPAPWGFLPNTAHLEALLASLTAAEALLPPVDFDALLATLGPVDLDALLASLALPEPPFARPRGGAP